jgi:hypothetical protein
MGKINEYMSNNFQVINTTLNLQQAIDELPRATYAVLHDGTEPKALIFSDDLHQAANNGISSIANLLQQLPPTVVVGSEIPMNQLANSSVMTLFDVGAKGAIVLGKQGVVGILPVEIIDQFIGSGNYQPLENVLGDNNSITTRSITDGILGGDYQTPTGIKICAYPGCSYPNVLADFDPDYPPQCKNPHLTPHSLQLT